MKKIILLLLTVFMFQLPLTSAAFAGDRIKAGESLCAVGCSLTSKNAKYMLNLTAYGNLELWKKGEGRSWNVIWSLKKNSTYISQLKLDYYSGKLMLTNSIGDQYWLSDNAGWSNIHYQGNPPVNLRGDLLILQEDGNLVLYNTTDLNRGWYPVWATDTWEQ